MAGTKKVFFIGILPIILGIFGAGLLLAEGVQSTPEFQQATQAAAQNNYDGAVNALQPLLNDPAYSAAAKIEMGNFRKKQAEAELAQAVSHYNDAASFLSEGVAGGAAKGNEGAKILYDIGLLHAEKLNDHAKAAEIYLKIIQNYPTFLSIDKVTYHLAACYEKAGKNEDAVRTYREIVDKYPYSSFLNVAHARIKMLGLGTSQAGAVIEAQETIVESARTDAASAKASMDLASMYMKQGDYKKAASEYKKVAAEAPTPEMAREAYQKLATILDEKEKDYKGAAGALEEMVTRFPNEPGNEQNLYKLGRIYENNLDNEMKTRVRGDQVLYKKSDENIQKALDYYNKVTESNPDADISADAYLRKGELYEGRLKDTDEAKKQYSEFLRRFPDHQDAEKIREKLKKLE